jgi:hypothetical protein
MIFKDPCKTKEMTRSVTKINWHPDPSEGRLAVAYAKLKFQSKDSSLMPKHSYIWNLAIPKVPFSKRWTYIVILAEPLFMQILSIISYFTILTLQLQFIIPQFIGSFIIEIPFTLQRLKPKEFEFP